MNKRQLSMLFAVAALVSSCATTEFQSTWKSPTAQPLQLRGRKVVAVFINPDSMLRRRAEDAMAREISARGAEGVPAYTFLSDRAIRDPEMARAKAQELGFAAAAVMRIVGSKTVYTHVHMPGPVWVGPPYQRFWGGYWGWGWGAVWQPGYLAVDRVVKVETLIYSLDNDELVWAGVSRTFDPGRIESFISELAVAVSEQLARERLIRRASLDE